MKKMYGVNTPIVCPMHEDGTVDYASLAKLCEYQIEKGVHGLYPNGSTGEMCYLSLDERKRVLECTIDAAQHRTQVFGMVGCLTTEDTITLAQHAERCGADGIGVVTPFYFKLDRKELVQHFKTVSQSVSKDFPIYLYGIPQYAVNDITPELAEEIADACPNVAGIKYSWADMPRLISFLKVRGGDFSVVAGVDDLFYCMLCSGGDGVISGAANVIPELYVAVYDAFKAGDHKRASALQLRINDLNHALMGANGMARFKAALKYRGVIAEKQMRRPLRELDTEEEASLIAQLESLRYTCVD